MKNNELKLRVMEKYFIGTEWLQPGAKGNTFDALMDLPATQNHLSIHKTYLSNYDYQLEEKYEELTIGEVKNLLSTELDYLLVLEGSSLSSVPSTLEEGYFISPEAVRKIINDLKTNNVKEVDVLELEKMIIKESMGLDLSLGMSCSRE